MSKKILGVCAALVALAALAIPASASAAATLRENGVKVPEGTKITAIGTEVAIFEAGGNKVECNENWMTGTVHTNNGTNIRGTIESAKFQSNFEAGTKCRGNALGATTVDIPALTNEGGNKHWCVENVPGTDNFNVFGRSCTEEGVGILTFKLTGNITCVYKREAAVTGHFTTTTGAAAATLTVTEEPEFTKEEGSFLCPANGKITQMAFKLYTDTNTIAESEEDPLQIDDVS